MGRIGAIRNALESAGHNECPAAQLCRQIRPRPFMAPSAMRSARRGRSKGIRKPTRWIQANSDEALRLVDRDLREGADMVMVKPGLPYLEHLPQGQGHVWRTDLCLSGLGRIRDDHGRSTKWLDRRGPRDDGKPDGLQARRL